jgi:hypothetical protein
LLRSTTFQHAATEAARLKEAIGADDNEMPTIFAGASGARGVAETADALNAERERRRERDDEEALRKETWAREDKRYERETDRENTRMHYEMEVARLKAQAQVVATGINRGLADHRDIEHVTSVLNGVVKSLEKASASPAQQERRAGDSGGEPVRDEPGDGDVVEAQVVPDDPDSTYDDADAGLREDDLGR